MLYNYKAFGLSFSSEIELPECLPAESTALDFRIVKARVSLPPVSTTNIHRRGIMAESGIDSNQNLYLNWKGVAAYRAIAGELLEVDAMTEENDVLSLFTVSEALAMILFQRGYFLLHASAVQIGEQAVVFMGAPGAGKSTTAAAFVKAGCRLLSDDLTAISFDQDNKPYVVPAYPQLKIWENTVRGLGMNVENLERVSEGVNKFAVTPRDLFPDKILPLGAFYFLHKARNKPRLRQMPLMKIPTETLKHFPIESKWLDERHLTRLFHQSIFCAQNAEMWEMRRPEGFDALENWVQYQMKAYESV